jgi:type I restriction enzyme S subunit
MLHQLRSESLQRKISEKTYGVALKQINLADVRKLKVIIPDIDIQNKFSNIADKIEGIKTRYQHSLTQLATLYGALSQQAFKGELDLSRVPLPDIKPEEEKAVVTAPVQASAEESLAISLPDTDNLLDALKNAEARKALIALWLEAYCGQLGNTPFSVQHFMAAAQTRLAELHPDNDFELGANDYEHIKSWVFAALEQGRLTQIYDDANNRAQLNASSL